MRLPMAYSLDYIARINRRRINLGILLVLAGALILKDNTYLVGPGTIALTPAYCVGMFLLLLPGSFFLWLGLTKKRPYFIFRIWPALRTPIVSLKKVFRETWEEMTTEL